MKQDCAYYFFSSTALQIWKTNDRNGENKMLSCLIAERKQTWFKSVIFKNGMIPEWRLTEGAEDAFVAAWNWFSAKGKSGAIELKKAEYTGLLYIVFKRFYLKFLEKEMVNYEAEKDFGSRFYSEEITAGENKSEAVFSAKTQKVLNDITAACSELLQWKYAEGISYEEIAIRKNLEREYCIKMMFRCKQYFVKKWKNIKARS